MLKISEQFLTLLNMPNYFFILGTILQIDFEKSLDTVVFSLFHLWITFYLFDLQYSQ